MVVFHGWGDLIPATIFPVQNIGDSQWQDALGGFFQGAVKETSFISCCATRMQ